MKSENSTKRRQVEFWSSTEYSGFLAGLIRELNASGFEAEQRFQISEASYRSAKSTPARLWLRFRQYVAYPAQLCAALVMRRVKGEGGRVKGADCEGGKAVGGSKNQSPDSCLLAPERDVCVVSTNTFYAPLLATYLHPNVVHLVYDLFPEAMIHSGRWQEGTLKVKLVRWITQQTLRRAKLNVFLGQRLQDYVESIHGAVPNSAIIAVGADQALFRRSPKQRVVTGECGLVSDAGSDEEARVEALRGEGGRRSPVEGRTSNMERPIMSDAGSDAEARVEALRGEGGRRNPVERRTSNIEHRILNDSCGGVATQGGAGASSRAPTILYCGNFGNMHESATLFGFWNQVAESVKREEREVKTCVQAAGRVGGDPDLNKDADSCLLTSDFCNAVAWRFHCSGPKRAELEAMHAELPDVLRERIQVGEGLGQAEWIRTMESADVALVTMVPGSETVVMPSKTYSAMMAGQAILAIAPKDSDLVDTIQAADCGWHVEPGDVDGLARAVAQICADADGLLQKRENAFRYAHAHLGQDALARRWEHALRAI